MVQVQPPAEAELFFFWDQPSLLKCIPNSFQHFLGIFWEGKKQKKETGYPTLLYCGLEHVKNGGLEHVKNVD